MLEARDGSSFEKYAPDRRDEKAGIIARVDLVMTAWHDRMNASERESPCPGFEKTRPRRTPGIAPPSSPPQDLSKSPVHRDFASFRSLHP